MIQVESYDIIGNQYVLDAVTNRRFSNHYSREGSGFGYFTFTLPRRTGINYPDVGQGYRVIVRKGLRKILFDGNVTKIDEVGDTQLDISCVGASSLVGFHIGNFILSDNRLNRWTGACENRGSFRPDKFDLAYNWTEIINEGTDTEEEVNYDGIIISPITGTQFVADDYIYTRYRFNFGESALKIGFTYKVHLPNNWPGRAVLEDSSGNVVWMKDVSSNGVESIEIPGNGTFVMFKFICTADGLNTSQTVVEQTGVNTFSTTQEIVSLKIWNIRIYSTTATVDATSVITKVAQDMHDNFDFSDDYSLIENIGFELEQAAFDGDMRYSDIATQVCQFGDENLNPLAWGVWYDDTRRFFLQKYNTSEIRYKLIEYSGASVSNDVSQSYQKVYGRIVDPTGQEKRTAIQTSQEVIDAIGLYRMEVLDLGEVTEDQATQAVTLALNENKQPAISTSFTVTGNIYDANNNLVPIEEIISGAVVTVPTFSAREASLLDDKRQGFYSFLLVGVEVDLETMEATLTPSEAISSFEKYMAKLERMKRNG